MVYRIFISHTKDDKLLAEEIKKQLNNAFQGQVKLYLAAHEIQGGEDWKREIKQNLQQCDAIMSIITPRSIHKPWIMIEWAAFWLQEKKYYTLLTEEIHLSDLINPMTDRQYIIISNTEDIKGLFRNLARESQVAEIPYDYVDDFVDGIRRTLRLVDQEVASQNYSKYKTSIVDLPRDDYEKRRITEYFYETEDYNTFSKILREIRDDAIKASIITKLLQLGDLDNVRNTVESVRSADKLALVALELINLGYWDVKLLKELIENIASKNQAELRLIAVHMVQLGNEDSDIFRFVIDQFSNMAELRKVVSYFVDNNKLDSIVMEDIIQQFVETNVAELRKVATLLIDANLFQSSRFRDIVAILANKNQKEAEKVFLGLVPKSPTLVQELLATQMITNASSLKRITDLLENPNSNSTLVLD